MEHFSVVIVGAGISGLSAACHLKAQCPNTSFAILEARPRIGGTWDLFKYPGVRSDSDMYTLGFDFKPWSIAKSIAEAPIILDYLNETVEEHQLSKHIQLEQKVISASWSSRGAQWLLTVVHEGQLRQVSCQFLFMGSGYYSYENPFTPEIPGLGSFAGPVIHPQQWPDSLDYSAKRVAVIGSGATAMTLVPAMAETAEHVTMIQRSPTYVVSRPSVDKIANWLRRWLPREWAYNLTRFKNIQMQRLFYKRSRVAPEKLKQLLLKGVRQALGPSYDINKHFNPSYNPWDQRICLIPDSDLYRTIRSGKTDVVTGHIDTVTDNSVKMSSGEEVPADILVTATGLTLQLLGGVQFDLDGEPVHFSEHLTYKGMMCSGLPNLINTFGYVNASWTLRADLNSKFLCRVLQHMGETGTQIVTPVLRDFEVNMPRKPWVESFTPGYIKRAIESFPKQGTHYPWQNTQDVGLDMKDIATARLEDGVLQFTRADAPQRSAA